LLERAPAADADLPRDTFADLADVVVPDPVRPLHALQAKLSVDSAQLVLVLPVPVHHPDPDDEPGHAPSARARLVTDGGQGPRCHLPLWWTSTRPARPRRMLTGSVSS
jgi:hypothetical protein